MMRGSGGGEGGGGGGGKVMFAFCSTPIVRVVGPDEGSWGKFNGLLFEATAYDGDGSNWYPLAVTTDAGNMPGEERQEMPVRVSEIKPVNAAARALIRKVTP